MGRAYLAKPRARPVVGYVTHALIEDFTPGADVDCRLAGSLHLVVVDPGTQGLQPGGCPEIQVFVFHQG